MSNLTEGQKRVRVSFNPNGLERVETFKNNMAQAMDMLDAAVANVKITGHTDPALGDLAREVATAKTQIQQASMWGTLALTHETMFKHYQEDKELKGYAPHEVRVIKERRELTQKSRDLNNFMHGNPIFLQLPAEDRKLLEDQYEIMCQYISILNIRISKFVKDINANK